MHHEDFHVHMSEEEKIAAEESLKAYGKTIELDNILQRRAKKNPLFLQRSLSYQIEAKHQRRIQMTVSLSDTQKLFPIYVLLARLVSPKPTAECSAVYKFSRACILTGVLGVDGVSQAQAKFFLPDMNELALEAKSGSLAILFISFARLQNSQFGIGSSNIHSGGIAYGAKYPWNLSTHRGRNIQIRTWNRKQIQSLLFETQPCSVQIQSMSEEKCIAIQVPSNPLTSSSPQQMKVTISAEEVAPTEKSPYNSLSFNDVPSSSMLEIIR
ncbi:Polycomb group protein EMBRYONIC FLOWER 2 [Raphanus sativus]|nr:Polycomb group protein EMBRYONIC FLOWER 2 [Raphanus sativus]